MAILSSIAFHSQVLIDDVPYEGIDRLQAEDIGTPGPSASSSSCSAWRAC